MAPLTRATLTATGAVAFGLAAGILHGNDGGLSAGFANLSAPWLLVALIPGWSSRSIPRGMLLGTVATLTALLGYYVGMTSMAFSHLGFTDPKDAFEFMVHANRIWFVAGLVSGPAMGAMGGHLGSRLGARGLISVSALLMCLEPLAIGAVRHVEIPVVHLMWGVADWHPYGAEAFAGVALTGVAMASRRRAANVHESGRPGQTLPH